MIEELTNRLALPEVDEHGYSECPFARELYEDKEVAARNLEKQFMRLQGYLMPLANEIDRCRKNLEKIKAGGGQIHSGDARNGYERARAVQLKEYNELIALRVKAYDLLDRATKLLKEASQKNWPEKEMQDNEPEGFQSTSERRINNLIEMGPIKGV